LDRQTPRFPVKSFAIVTALAFLIRLALLLVYQPVPYGDTPSYRRLAQAVLNGFQRYDGTRTPGYPAFLALLGPDQNVYLAQLFLGLLTTLLLFWMMWRLSANAWLSSAAALLHTLNLGQLFFEANLLTETLTTFWLVLSLSATLLLLSRPHPSLWLSFGIGLTSSLAAITRPLFVYLPFWLLLFAVWHAARTATPDRAQFGLGSLFTRRSLLTALALLLPAALILGGWVNFIHTRYHMWSLSVMTGYHMIQHTGNFFEYLPDEEAALRDTYLRYRDAHIAEFGTQTNTIWEAIPEMQEVSGLTFYDLSRKLSSLSVGLIAAHPALFLRSVLQGWWMFWRAPVYWQADAFRLPFLAALTPAVVLLERALLVAANLIFVIASLPALFIKRLQQVKAWQRAFVLCLTGMVWIGSIVQSLLDHGDNPRFLVPMQSLVVLSLLWFGAQVWRSLRKKA
jgi:hypothetical protein